MNIKSLPIAVAISLGFLVGVPLVASAQSSADLDNHRFYWALPPAPRTLVIPLDAPLQLHYVADFDDEVDDPNLHAYNDFDRRMRQALEDMTGQTWEEYFGGGDK